MMPENADIERDSIEQNLKEVQDNIAAACRRAGRNPSEVTLIAVSKTKPVSLLLDAYGAGQRQFGENKVQEIAEKYPLIPRDAHFHMIGHLQTNKVRQVIDKVSMIHSIDSFHLAKAVSSEAVKKGIKVDVLLEVNVAGEDSKYGVACEDTENLLIECAGLPGIFVRGLMTVAPYTENQEENRRFFNKLRQLCVDLRNKNIDNTSMDVLSMGMTGDYQAAIEEGATMIRVGTGIFGARNYNM